MANARANKIHIEGGAARCRCQRVKVDVHRVYQPVHGVGVTLPAKVQNEREEKKIKEKPYARVTYTPCRCRCRVP